MRKPSDSERDNLLITMACRAGYLQRCGFFDYPSGVAGEDALADFVRDSVDEYINREADEPFDFFMGNKLMNKTIEERRW